MPRRCPEGTICFDGFTLFILVCVVGVIAYVVKERQSIVTNVDVRNQPAPASFGGDMFVKPGYGYSVARNDVLLNPYSPPLVHDFGFGARGVPINVPTQGYQASYSQVGLLTRGGGQETILPLMGRATIQNRDKWAYYAISDQNNSVKLPIVRGGRSCSNDTGCDRLYNGDTVYVEGYNSAFNVTMYESGSMQYIPYM